MHAIMHVIVLKFVYIDMNYSDKHLLSTEPLRPLYICVTFFTYFSDFSDAGAGRTDWWGKAQGGSTDGVLPPPPETRPWCKEVPFSVDLFVRET
jgi:hypothetical protein